MGKTKNKKMRCKYCGKKLSEYCDEDCKEDHRKKLFDEDSENLKKKKCPKEGCKNKIWLEQTEPQIFTTHKFCKKHQKEEVNKLDKIIKDFKKNA